MDGVRFRSATNLAMLTLSLTVILKRNHKPNAKLDARAKKYLAMVRNYGSA